MKAFALAVCLLGTGAAVAQDSPAAATPDAVTTSAPAVAQTTPAGPQGGTIHGVVGVGEPGKPGFTPLPGVAVMATNTLTGKKYTTATDVDGNYAMSIPKSGRYVVRAEIIGFAATTSEVLLNGDFTAMIAKQTSFSMQLASRAAAAEAKQEKASSTSTASLTRGLQGLSLSANTESESAGSAGNTGATMPSLANLNDSVTGESATAGADSIAVSGQSGQMNGLAGISEDDMRSRIQEGIERARANGQIPEGMNTNEMVAGVMGMLMGPGGGGGRGGGGGGGHHGGGGGSGAFRNFNPAQPHGSIFWQGGNSALNATPWQASNQAAAHFLENPSSYSNNYGVTIGGSPYLPGLTQPNSKQFVFLNITGHRNLNAYTPNAVRVPTIAERNGDFTQSYNRVGGKDVPVQLYDPATGATTGGALSTLTPNLLNPQAISQQALALLNYYPQPNIITSDPTDNNYQTISNAGNNSIAVNTRYVRTIGGAADNPFGGFGGGGRHGGGNSNTPPSLRQNINASYNFSHSAADNRNVFLELSTATATDGHALNAGYTIGYGRLSNNASISWNRNDSEVRNYFTDTANDPNSMTGISVPNRTSGFADSGFYNGLASIGISNFQSISILQPPSKTVNQTISFSDFVSYRHAKHNYRFGFDIRRVHADSIGGNNPLGSFSFTGYATAAPADQVNGQGGQASGSAFADFLLGLPQSTSLQAGSYKIYLRENVYDGYAQDDWRILPNVTLNYGLRYEYFAPYTEKNGRLTNLDHNEDFTNVLPVMPNQIGPVSHDKFNASLIDPDRTMFSPRVGVAWNPKFKSKLLKEMVIRAGYGVGYNTSQFATFAQSLSQQSPFANTQTNNPAIPTVSSPTPSATGCTTTQSQYTFTATDPATGLPKQYTRPATAANMTTASGFNCSGLGTTNNFAVDRDYRLGMVQTYNLNIQKTLGASYVLNVGYAGSVADKLDVVGAPTANPTTSGSTIADVSPFKYHHSLGDSRGNSLVIGAQKRQSHGIALGATYTYSHIITNASGIGGGLGTPVQNYYRLDEEYGNATGNIDQRHNLTGTWVTELPFGPNRAFLNKGGVWAKILDGYSLSGSFTFGSGHYFTPQYAGNQTEASSGNVYTLRPNRDYTKSTKGPGKLGQFFNTAAFLPPASGQYGSASPGSIEGPGTVSVNSSLSRTLQFAGTNSLEFRVTATNVFNTVQYSGISTTENSANFGQVTSAASMRVLQINARYRF